MKTLYSIGIYLYGGLIALAATFNKKARKLFVGQSKALSELKKNVQPHTQYVWIHAASLGEFEQGRPLIEKIKQEQPDTPILLTFYSPSGYEAKKNYPFADIISYLPLDTPRAAKRFIKIAKPSQAIFIKYEFWPNYLQALKQAQVPVFTISSIFRPDQLFFKSYGKWYLSLLKTFNHIFVQDEASEKLLVSKGIKQVTIAGDTRFDRVYDQSKLAKQFPLIEQFVANKSVIIAGSTWLKDEILLAQYLNEHPAVKMIIVPHEVDNAHLQDLFKLLQGNYIRYSEMSSENLESSNCLIIDTIGILSSIYQYATIAYIGGGFGVGIHNILEAATYNVAVVFGPNYRKFNEARQLVEFGGGFSVNNYDELNEKFNDLLNNPKEAGNIAGKYVRDNTGSTEKIIHHLKQTTK